MLEVRYILQLNKQGVCVHLYLSVGNSLPKRVQRAQEVLEKSSSELQEIAVLSKGIVHVPRVFDFKCF